MNLNKKIKFIILAIIAVLACFGFIDKVKAEYHTLGTLVSQNLLDAQNVDSIDNFGYDATIPANTTLKVQFTQNQTNWYNSTGTENGWDTLSDGDYLASGDAIDLSGLGWSGPYFFYKIVFETTDTAATPVLDEIKLYWDEGSAPATAYHTSGTLVSNNILEGTEVNNIINSFYYNASSIPAGTSLRVQFSQDNTNWYNSAEEADAWDNCSEGDHLIDLSGLGWSGLSFYYKIEFISDGNSTPVLDEIKVYYTSGSVSDYPDPLEFGQNITFSVEWPYSRDFGIKMYVCKAEDGTSSGCGGGGTWCSNSNDFDTANPITCVYPTQEGDIGINNYYVYICDSGSNCSSAVSGTFTVQAVSTPSKIFKGGIWFKGGTIFK